MKKKFLLTILMLILCLSLTSCDAIYEGLKQFSIQSYTGTVDPSKTTTVDETPTTTVTDEEGNVITTTVTDEEGNVITTTVAPIVAHLEYGYYDLDNYQNAAKLKAFYDKVLDKVQEFDESSINVTPKNYTIGSETKGYYEIANVSFAVENLSSNEAYAVLKLVELDHPEYYFFSNEALVDSSKALHIMIDEEYALASTRQTIKTNINNFFNSVDALLSESMSNADKVGVVHNYIINHAEYAFKTDGVTPNDSRNAHNIVGITSEGKGVCESYTELFTYILKRLGIPCITVTGTGNTGKGSEGHAWNYVFIDGAYYAFDVTWDDTTHSNNYFGLSRANILNDHTPNETGNMAMALEYLYVLPSLSESNLG